MSSPGGLAGSLGHAVLLVAVVAAPLALFSWAADVEWVEPAGLVLAALGLPLALLFLLRARRPRRRVGSTLLWRPVSADQRASHPFQRLRRSLVLLLLLGALGAIAYGRARPVVQGSGREGRAVALILDVSASMLTRDHGGETRFAAARARALELVADLGPDDEAALIAVDRSARTITPWTGDRHVLRQGLASLEPTHLTTRLGEGLLLAASGAPPRARRREVHLLTDGGGPPPPPVELGAPVDVHRFGVSAENVAVIAAGATPRLRGAGDGRGLSYEVFATVRNAGEAPRRLFVALEQAGRTIAARAVDLPAGADVPVVLAGRLSPGPAAVRLLPPRSGEEVDAQPVDDAGWVVIPAAGGVRATLVSAAAGAAVRRALEAAGADVTVRAPPFAPDLAEDARLYVFHGHAPARLPPRDCLVIAPDGPVGPVQPSGTLDRPRIVAWDRRDPLLRHVDLAGVSLEAALRLTLRERARAVVQGEDAAGQPAPLVATWAERGARRVVLAFDPERSTWPRRASFPIFIKGCVDRAAGLARGAAVAAGLPVQLPVGPTVTRAEVVDPRGQRTAVQAAGGHATFAGTAWVGAYRLEAGSEVVPFCVPAVAADEARIAPQMPQLARARQAQDRPEAARRPVEVGRWLALVALALLTVEAWAHHRRW